mmetsp:Transcript_8054/g.13819  ORF Transcript_8054/g.13819 Transcript_8054/m.13819 type:complete len:135 (+) Transcript_8054:15-419(+)|eukprot:CAMPEP_0196651882 /NCGR_PEP_ID=MMETSP1086-20130531/1070_1 /TAXON_ID=77921 /ORGANISM="Cyanoptyche  gloeocystis , Strain SAG4.97" /LENGTH=134 /DNA_ID=CAMNT_0041982173 /DNA_START=15 /DNA_END=419 /DNA_ORIENTATION=-
MVSAALVIPSIATLSALVVYQGTSLMVGIARGKYGVKAPATTGHPDFERVFRVHQNTAENLLTFIPGIFLYAHFMNPVHAGYAGAVWVLGRILYAVGYYSKAEKREAGFLLSYLSQNFLVLGALYGAIKAYSAS